MGLGLRFGVFLLLELPIVLSAFSCVIFVSALILSFFFSGSMPGVFPTFIYLLNAHGGFSKTGETH